MIRRRARRRSRRHARMGQQGCPISVTMPESRVATRRRTAARRHFFARDARRRLPSAAARQDAAPNGRETADEFRKRQWRRRRGAESSTRSSPRAGVNAPAYGADDVHGARGGAAGRNFRDRRSRRFSSPPARRPTRWRSRALARPWEAVFCHEESACPRRRMRRAGIFHRRRQARRRSRPRRQDHARRACRDARPLSARPRQVVAARRAVAEPGRPRRARSTRVDEIAALAEIARAAGLRVHMDGARFANASSRCGASPAEMTWRAGDRRAVVRRDQERRARLRGGDVLRSRQGRRLPYQRKRGGHTLSKGRFLGAQMEAYLEGRSVARSRRGAPTPPRGGSSRGSRRARRAPRLAGRGQRGLRRRPRRAGRALARGGGEVLRLADARGAPDSRRARARR